MFRLSVARLWLSNGARTKVWVGLQMSLQRIDEVPAGEEDQNGSSHVQGLYVFEKSLDELERGLLLVDQSHGSSCFCSVVRPTD